MRLSICTYLEKSHENLETVDWALENGHFNVAASRYYYALRLAGQGYFSEFHPELLDLRDHDDFITELNSKLCDQGIWEPWMKEAQKLRWKADYSDLDVGEFQLTTVKKNTSKILEEIHNAISRS